MLDLRLYYSRSPLPLSVRNVGVKQVVGLLVVASVCAAKAAFVEQLLRSDGCWWRWAVSSLPCWGSGCSSSEEADLRRVKMLQNVTGEVLHLFLTAWYNFVTEFQFWCLFKCHWNFCMDVKLHWREDFRLIFPLQDQCEDKKQFLILRESTNKINF